MKSGIVSKVANSALQADSGNRDGCYDWRANQSAFWSSQGKSAHHQLITRRAAPMAPADSGQVGSVRLFARGLAHPSGESPDKALVSDHSGHIESRQFPLCTAQSLQTG